MNKHHYVLWLFMAAVFIMLIIPLWLSFQALPTILHPGFTWWKGVVLLAFVDMTALYFYSLIQLFFGSGFKNEGQ